ncbi:hypothetical protein FJTKL_10700 [Diaporthe vaccinii]|uniref:Uncharacterized protein n=1 Tax=Diaporthe vaccinii TaxID=105482 RepID=A0ABR4FBI1_9PEZI
MYRFNSHLNIALPDLQRPVPWHQSVTPLQKPPEQWHAWNLHTYSQIPSTIHCKRLCLTIDCPKQLDHSKTNEN